jgi:DNA-binding NtrC family response regulator
MGESRPWRDRHGRYRNKIIGLLGVEAPAWQGAQAQAYQDISVLGQHRQAGCIREWRKDIRLLVEHILAKHDAEDDLADLPENLREMLYHYDWPGNVRELTNTIQRYLATDSVALPGRPRQASDQNLPTAAGLHDAMESLERKMIAAALQQTQWHRGGAARLLKIPRRTLQRKIQKYGLASSD